MHGRRWRMLLGSAAVLASVVAVPHASAATPTVVSCPAAVVPAVTSGTDTLRTAAAPLGLDIGAALPSYELMSANPEDREVAAREFDIVASSNQMYWSATEPQRDVYNVCHGDEFAGFAAANGQKLRFHNLIAGNLTDQTPAWVLNGTWTRDELISVMRDYIHTVVGHFRGKVAIWDVVNETVRADGTPVPNVFEQVIGYPAYVELAFTFAREADPNALLMYDDTAAKPGPKQDAVYALIQDLKSKNIPIDVAGVEMFGYAYTTDVTLMESNLLSSLNRFGSLGVQTAITQMNVPQAADTDWYRNFQASYYRAALDACLTTTGGTCHTFMMWGFSDTYGTATAEYDQLGGNTTGGSYGTIFDSLYRPKPAYAALLARLKA